MTNFSTSRLTTFCEASPNEQASASPLPLTPSSLPSESTSSLAGEALKVFSLLVPDVDPGIQLLLEAVPRWLPLVQTTPLRRTAHLHRLVQVTMGPIGYRTALVLALLAKGVGQIRKGSVEKPTVVCIPLWMLERRPTLFSALPRPRE